MKDKHAAQLNWNNGRYWLLSIDHIVVYSPPFPLVRSAQPHGCWLGMWWIRSGRGEAALDETEITLSKGDVIFFTPEMCLHGRHDADEPIELIGIRFSFLDDQGTRFLPSESTLPRGHYRYNPLHPFDQVVLQLLKCWRHALDPEPAILHGIGMQIMGIAKAHCHKQSERAFPIHPKYSKKMTRLIDLIQDQYDKPWTTESLAREIDMHPAYMTKLFKRFMGTALKHYLVRTRIQAAESYLTETDTPIGTIAEMCGYRDLYFFSRQFKQILGLSPTEYRQEMTGRDPVREALDRVRDLNSED